MEVGAAGLEPVHDDPLNEVRVQRVPQTVVVEPRADLRVRDLRLGPITSVQGGSPDIPTLTLTRDGTGLTITLDFAGDQLSDDAAIALVSNFAGQMEQPLRHLL